MQKPRRTKSFIHLSVHKELLLEKFDLFGAKKMGLKEGTTREDIIGHPYEYIVLGECNNVLEDGRCGMHPETD